MAAENKQARRGIICAGNWIVDLVHDVEHWPYEHDLVRINKQNTGIGGGAANVISDLTSLGADFPLLPVGKIGTDQYGDFVLAHCQQFNLSTEYLVRAKGTATAHTHVMNVPGSSRTFFYQGGTNDTFGPADIPMQTLADTGARLFYLGYLLLLAKLDTILDDGTTYAASVLEQAKALGMQTCVDLVSTDTPQFMSIVNATLHSIDYLFVNEVEAARACGMDVPKGDKKWTSQDTKNAATTLLERGVQQGVFVHTPDTALYQARDGTELWCAPEPVPQDNIVSAVGAGDAFCAGALYGIHEGWDMEETLKLAHRVAGASLSGQTATDCIPTLKKLMPL